MFKFFTSDLRRNLIKILCLTVGLTVGMLLVAKIYFEQTYDSFFPEIDRLYRITESVVENGEYKEYDYTPGGTAHEIERHIPQIQKATRFTVLTDQLVIKLEDGRKFDMPYITLADTCLFDVLSTPIVEGNPHTVLAVRNQVMIPLSLAKKIGGDVIGLQFGVAEWGDSHKFTIGGVYKDYPLNSTIANAVYLAMPTSTSFMWEGSTENLIGNDRYKSYALLDKNVDPLETSSLIVEHLKTKIPEEAFLIGDYKIWVRPLKDSYSTLRSVKTMSWMLGLLALIILVCAGLNYLLIVIGQLSSRGKEMAIRKCYGTGEWKIFRMMLGESVFYLMVSFVLSLLLAFSFTDLCKDTLGYSPEQLFSIGKVWGVEALICLGLMFITGVLPSLIYCRTPVAHAFRPTAHGGRIWKLTLLAVQFFATGMMMCLLLLVGRQYSMVGNLDLGLDYENIGIFYRHPMTDEKTATVIEELKKLPFVEGVSSSDSDPAFPYSGNNMWTEGQDENQVNIAEMGALNPDLFEVMGIEFVQGRTFSENADSTIHEIIVDEKMIDVLQKYFGETDRDIIGKKIVVTGHPLDDSDFPLFTIVGVTKNVRRGGFENDRVDTRAAVYSPSKAPRGNVFIKFKELTPDNLSMAQKVLDSLNDGDDIYITPYKARIESKSADIRRFGTSVMIVGITIILLALIGLIGYVADEVNRRAKEIAIRKVNGTDAWKIVRLFCIDVLKVALPSLILGGAAAMIIGQRWLSQFTDRVSLSPISMIGSLLFLLLIIMAVVIINTLRVARSNPIDHLRSE